jgi:FMN-dependent NADH-azoreductase
MTHLLHLDASPRGDRSVSRALSKEFITHWKASHPKDAITYRDLGHHPVPLVDETWIAAAFSAPSERTFEQANTIAISDELVDEFLAADCYVIGIPMYNFSYPAGFKAYIDQIVRAGRTFSVEADGSYKGLATRKKMLIITARSGSFRQGTAAHAYDFQEPYLRLIFGFMGITDITVIHADNLAAGENARAQSLAQAKTELLEVVEQWSVG